MKKIAYAVGNYGKGSAGKLKLSVSNITIVKK
jgi:hypothetical protein